jgi:pimeloyl-ACP methyl ester carboxylesterase
MKENKQNKQNNTAINWHVTGDGDIVLFFVHGAFTDQAYWKKQVDYFSKNYTVVTIDLAGHGKSGRDRTDWSVENFAEDVQFVIQQLNLKNVILIGHSIAADINLLAAARHPSQIIGFIAIDAFKNAGTPLPDEYRNETNKVLDQMQVDFENAIGEYVRTGLVSPETPPEVAERVVDDYQQALQPMALQVMTAILNMDVLERKWLPELQAELHIINVDNTPTNWEALKQYAKNGFDLSEINATSHFPMLESPAELNHLLEQAIYKIEHADAVY